MSLSLVLCPVTPEHVHSIDEVRFNRGIPFVLMCQVDAAPPAKLTLLRNGMILNTSSSNMLSHQLTNPTFSDIGFYLCMAVNSFGSLNYTFSLIVQGEH